MDPFTGILSAGVGQTVAAPDYLQAQRRPWVLFLGIVAGERKVRAP
jgi:hypothetical protein